LNNNGYPLFIYYGLNSLQFEPLNFASISSYKLNINQLHEFTLDRAIQINVGSIFIIGINSTEKPNNNYNSLYGIFKIDQVRRTFTNVDQSTLTGYTTTITAHPIEIDQIFATDTILFNTTTNITSNTYYNNYNLSVSTSYSTSELINLIKQNVYTDISINTLVVTPINSISQYLINQTINKLI
jgi:hypothetical protein